MPTLFTGQYCRAAIAFVALLLAGLSFGVPEATAQSLRVSGGYHWTVLASTKDLDNAIGIARIYGRNARVVLSTNGWYATVLAPEKGSLADMAKAISWPGFPKDAFLSNGRGFATVVWKPKSVLIDKADLDDGRPAEVSGAGLDVTVRRIRNGDGWTAEIDGRIGGRDVFSLSRPFPDASHFQTSVKLVRLQPADPYPDVGEAGTAAAGRSLSRRRVATALHGLKDEGTVIARDKANDLALIRTHVSSQSVAHIRGGARLGEDVSVFGFPLAGFLASSGNFTRGNITAAAGLQDDTRYFQISAPVQPGNSGGPLLDRYGNVVGIVVAKLNALAVASVTDDLAQNVNFAIKASIAESFLTANGVKSTTGEADKMLAPEDIAAKAESFAVEVECRPGEKQAPEIISALRPPHPGR